MELRDCFLLSYFIGFEQFQEPRREKSNLLLQVVANHLDWEEHIWFLLYFFSFF